MVNNFVFDIKNMVLNLSKDMKGKLNVGVSGVDVIESEGMIASMKEVIRRR